MDILILLTYTAVAVAVFKIFKLPVNAYTIVTAAFGGIGLLGALLILMNFNHPYTKVGRFYFSTTPIISQVKGRVVEVPVSHSQHVKAGDVLFRLDDTPFKATVQKCEAQLVAAKQHAAELNTNVVAYDEAYQAAIAQRSAAEDTYTRDKQAFQTNSISASELEQAKQSHLAAIAQASQAKAELERAKMEAASSINGVHTEILTAQADLDSASFDLDQTTVRAPTDGTVLQVNLRKGMMSVPMPFAPDMIFQHDESRFFVASFLQNSAQRIKEGADAEVIFASIPGRIFKGKVKLVGAAIAQGQLQPSGSMIDTDKVTAQGRINVVIEFDESSFDGFYLIAGSTGEVAVYSDHFQSLSIIRKILMRMKSWTNYLFTDG